jgi:hypothetical protein
MFKAGAMADDVSDSEEQKKKFEDDPEGYNQYCRDLEGELNKRFTLVRPLIQPNSVPPFPTRPISLVLTNVNERRTTSTARTKNHPAT